VAATLTAHAENGTPPYTFTLLDDGDGLSIDTSGDDATIRGTFTSAGDFPLNVRVQDKSGDLGEARVILHAHETPVVTTTALPDACPNEMYSTTISARGGEGGDYVFKIDVDPATGLVGNGDVLSGHFQSLSAQPDLIDVNVSVQSGSCTSPPVTLNLKQDAPGTPVCPQITIYGGDPTLPAPCAGQEYGASFVVSEGTPGYLWKQVSAPAGFAFDANAQSVTGMPTADSARDGGDLIIQVTDLAGRTIEDTFSIAPARNKCWLAYLAPSSGATRLNLFDPLLDNRRTFPDPTDTDPVLDFKFSPDGRLLAYRTGLTDSSGQLSLVELATFRQQTLDFSRVEHYAWAGDSLTLAVSFETEQGRFLSGVDVTGDGGPSTVLAFPELTAVAADVDSDLLWFAGTQLAFFNSDFDNRLVMTTAHSGASFSAPFTHNDDAFSEGSYLHPAPSGVFAVPSSDYVIAYFPDDDSDAVAHDSVLLAPTAGIAAGASDATLEVFRPGSASYPPPVQPDATSPDCDTLVSVSDSKNDLGGGTAGASNQAAASILSHVACAHTVQSDPERAQLVVFNVDPDIQHLQGPLQVADPITVRGDYDFPSSGRTGLARLFSASGKRFAFATDTSVYSTPVVVNGATVDLSFTFDAGTAGADAVFAFSPDDRWLLEHRGTHLNLFDLTNTPHLVSGFILAGEDSPLAPACSEDFRAQPGDYCGEFRAHASFAWSPDSSLVAVATSSGSLLVKDLRFSGQASMTTTTVTDDCGISCLSGERFAFQP
jgi:hypothetical protein